MSNVLTQYRHRMLGRPRPRFSKGLLAGLAGGVAGTLAMTAVQQLLAAIQRNGDQDQQDQDQARQANSSEPAPVKAATAIAEPVARRELTQREKKIAGSVMHYGFGTTAGALYGLLAEAAPAAGAGRGLLFGTALWLTADEAAVPALGLSPPPTKMPASTHANALISHLAFGFVADLVRRVIRAKW